MRRDQDRKRAVVNVWTSVAVQFSRVLAIDTAPKMCSSSVVVCTAMVGCVLAPLLRCSVTRTGDIKTQNLKPNLDHRKSTQTPCYFPQTPPMQLPQCKSPAHLFIHVNPLAASSSGNTSRAYSSIPRYPAHNCNASPGACRSGPK